MIFFTAMSVEEQDSRLRILHDEHAKLLYKTAYQILNDSRDAKDAVYDTLKRVRPHLHKIGDPAGERARGYAVEACKSVALDMLAQRGKYGFEDIDNHTQIADDRYNPERRYLAKERTLQILNALNNIDEKYKQVMKLSVLHKFDMAIIAQMLGIKKDTAYKRLERGRLLVKKELVKEDMYEIQR